MEKVVQFEDLSASNADEAQEILDEMTTVESYGPEDRWSYRVHYNTDDQQEINDDFARALASLNRVPHH